MHKVLLAAVALSMPLGAYAQTTTRCGEEAGQWVCREDRQRVDPFAAHAARLEAERARNAKATAVAPPIYSVPPAQVRDTIAEAAREGRAREVRKIVGEMVAGGRCGEARAFALTEGELDLAEQAQRLCNPTAP